jgi:hypothetical protein
LQECYKLREEELALEERWKLELAAEEDKR